MKKQLLTTLCAVCVSVFSIAQTAVLPTSWNFATAILPTGWSGISALYAASGNPAPAGKFAAQGDKLTISFNSTPGLIQYDLAGNPPPGGTWAGVFTVEESTNGATWTTVGTAYTTLATTYTTLSNTLNAASRYARFNFTTKTTGNVGIDNVSIATGVSTAQEISVLQGTTTIVNGGTFTLSSAVSTMTPVNFTVKNLGTVSTLSVANAVISGVAASDYSVSTTTPFSVTATSNSPLVVNFTPSVAGTRNAILTITNDDVNSNPYIINLNGIGGNLASEPTAQPTAMTFPIIKSYRIVGSYTAAAPVPDGYLVLRRTGAAITDVPIDGVVYQRGDMIGNSKVVYSASTTSFFPNDIIANTQYYFSVFAYNGIGTYRNYLTASPLTGNVTSSGTMQPTGYYSTISTSNTTFVTDLHTITNPHTLQLYSSYGPIMAATFYTRDTTANQRVITCVYSGQNKVYSEPFDWATENFSREHTYCQSWQPTVNDPGFQNRPEYNDYHMITPTNQIQVNGIRSNNPLGIVVGTPISTYLGCKLGLDANGHKVFEPRDSDKGDAARCMLYQCLTYTGVAYTGLPNTNATYGGSWALPSYISSINPYEQNQDILKQWNTQDPPDNFEIARNDYVDSLQGNRNPFIDHPEFVCFVDFSNMTYISNQSCGTTGINENKSDELISIAPNPNNGNFMVKYNSSKNEKVSMKLYDMVGHLVYSNETKVNSGINPIEMNVQNLTKGIYFFEFATENGKQTDKIVIQ